jgi:hypothetical protein
MAILDDLNAAVRDYCKNYVTLKIQCDLATDCVSGTQGDINVDEVWRFRVEVQNHGVLNVTNLGLHIEGQSYTHDGKTKQVQVSNSSTSGWRNYLNVGIVPSVNSGGSQLSPYYYFKAPDYHSGAPVPLVKVHVSDFDANLDSILKTNTGHANPPEIFSFTEEVRTVG